MQSSIETTATIGANRHLILDEDIPVAQARKVRVIVLVDEDIDETEWLHTVSANRAFDFLADEDEDIYKADDGEPLTDEA
jgi:hypothetical protein